MSRFIRNSLMFAAAAALALSLHFATRAAPAQMPPNQVLAQPEQSAAPASANPAEVVPATDAKQERATLNGTWQVTALTINGEEVPAETLKQVPWVWVIDDNKIVSKRPGAGGRTIHEEEIGFALDPSKSPKTLEFTDVARQETSKGIYETMNDDVLTICIPMKPTGDRPTDFAARKGSEQVSIRMARTSRQ